MKEDRYESLKIVNIVTSGLIADSIDLSQLSRANSNCKFNSKQFPGAVIRMEEPKFAALIFASGKVVLTGFQAFEDVSIGLKKFLDILKQAELPYFDDPMIKISNMVCSYNLGYPCNLNKIMMTFNCENVEYEPEQFPGLVYRLSDPKLAILIFATGKIILAGGTNLDAVKRGLKTLKEKIDPIM